MTMELWYLSTPPSVAWCDGYSRVVVERPTLTDTSEVFGCKFQPTRVGRSTGSKFAYVHPSISGRYEQNGEASGSGLVPEVFHYSLQFTTPALVGTSTPMTIADRLDAGGHR